MTQTGFDFHSTTAEDFSVVSFIASKGISQLYHYGTELKASVVRAIDMDSILENPATLDFRLSTLGNITAVFARSFEVSIR